MLFGCVSDSLVAVDKHNQTRQVTETVDSLFVDARTPKKNHRWSPRSPRAGDDAVYDAISSRQLRAGRPGGDDRFETATRYLLRGSVSSAATPRALGSAAGTRARAKAAAHVVT
ncbi:hypothetical protein MTO96_002089 [Rhipicephalus appendiculatus]